MKSENEKYQEGKRGYKGRTGTEEKGKLEGRVGEERIRQTDAKEDDDRRRGNKSVVKYVVEEEERERKGT